MPSNLRILNAIYRDIGNLPTDPVECRAHYALHGPFGSDWGYETSIGNCRRI